MKTRKLIIALAVAALAALAVPSMAMANFGVHGNYTSDTAACAGCHRAHTSYSSVTWEQVGGPGEDRSALLVGNTTEVWEFCYVCHGADAPGADTNVEDGIYEGDENGTTGGQLNGGGFGRPGYEDGTWTSTHMLTGSWGAFGGETTGMEATRYDLGTGPAVSMGCGACHDPHGSPNYRILKSSLAGSASGPVNVGGYVGPNNDPDPFVRSTEEGYPAEGFRLGTEYPSYVPNYTTPKYAKGYDMALAEDASRGMSGWCAGCHTQYINESSQYAAGEWVGAPSNFLTRHRHPMNTELDNYWGPDRNVLLNNISSLEPTLPVAHDISEIGGTTTQATDWVECLTCHRSHGTKATMEGFASEAGMESIVDETGFSTNPYVGNEVSALLRVDNRGVCQGCHNK